MEMIFKIGDSNIYVFWYKEKNSKTIPDDVHIRILKHENTFSHVK